MTEQELRAAYKGLSSHPAWRPVVLDLIGLAAAEKDPAVALGIHKVLGHGFDMILRDDKEEDA